jgi:hypothetical protein
MILVMKKNDDKTMMWLMEAAPIEGAARIFDRPFTGRHFACEAPARLSL